MVTDEGIDPLELRIVAVGEFKFPLLLLRWVKFLPVVRLDHLEPFLAKSVEVTNAINLGVQGTSGFGNHGHIAVCRAAMEINRPEIGLARHARIPILRFKSRIGIRIHLAEPRRRLRAENFVLGGIAKSSDSIGLGVLTTAKVVINLLQSLFGGGISIAWISLENTDSDLLQDGGRLVLINRLGMDKVRRRRLPHYQSRIVDTFASILHKIGVAKLM
mmetsp:Transcript_6337/g.17684  ORF Transcript_6337/g.17684 Transcript_6337/m.17684 type:complete len:217 (+) Transcript_6337:2253-2903(+)